MKGQSRVMQKTRKTRKHLSITSQVLLLTLSFFFHIKLLILQRFLALVRSMEQDCYRLNTQGSNSLQINKHSEYEWMYMPDWSYITPQILYYPTQILVFTSQMLYQLLRGCKSKREKDGLRMSPNAWRCLQLRRQSSTARRQNPIFIQFPSVCNWIWQF